MTALLRVAVAAAVLPAWWVVLAVAERRRPLRPTTQPRRRRVAVNLAVAAASTIPWVAAYVAVVVPVSRAAARHDLGLLRWLGLRGPAGAALAVALLDYTLWHWHRLNHRVPLLWRFHEAHHVDPDLDVSTALRFHGGELVLSVPFRAAQVALLGVELPVLLAWEVGTLAAAFFHHANWRLPGRLDERLRGVVVTPHLHGIHHSIDPADQSTNFGTISSLWDRLHGCWRDDRDDHALRMGTPARPERPRPGLIASLRWPWTR